MGPTLLERFAFVFRPSHQSELRPILSTIQAARGAHQARLNAPDAILGWMGQCDEDPHRIRKTKSKRGK